MKIAKWMLVLILICALLLPGCATMSDTNRTRAEGTGIGALVGAGVGALVGGKRGAAIGAVAGAGVGFLVGNEVARRKQNYVGTEEFLDAEIANTQEYNRTARDYNQKLSTDIAALEKESRTLRADYDKGKVKKRTLIAKRDDLQKRMAQNKKLEENLSKELEVQTAILEQERKELPAGDQRVAKLEKEVKALQKNLDTLRDGSTQLARIDQRLSV